MSKRDVVYDPTDVQLEAYGNMQKEDFGLDDLSSPQVVNLLIQQQIFNLYKLKALEKDAEKLRENNSLLQNERENLRVKLAESWTSSGVEFAEILISFLGGFAINILTNDWKDGLGWVLFLLSLFILLSFRLPRLSNVIEKYFGKEN